MARINIFKNKTKHNNDNDNKLIFYIFKCPNNNHAK